MAGINVAVFAALALLAGTAIAAAPTRPQAGTAPDAAANFREVTDETGRHVKIPVAAKRVVSLAPSLTETMYALGLQDRLVGDTDFCDYPADAMKKHKVGGPINPSLEEVASLHPDLVLMKKGMNRFETVNALERLGIPAYATDPQTVDEIVASVRRLAEILGAPEAGVSVSSELEQKLAGLKQTLIGVAPKKVLFVVWTEPLISVGQHTFVADALRHAGATSIVESRQDWPQMSLEEVVHLQPEYLVFASSHSEMVERDFETLSRRPGWNSLEAVKNRKFAVISDAINRPAPRLVSAIEDLARQLHPDVFAPKQPESKPEDNTPGRTKASAIGVRSKAGASAVENEVCACAR